MLNNKWISSSALIAAVLALVSVVNFVTGTFASQDSRISVVEDRQDRASPILQDEINSSAKIDAMQMNVNRIDANVSWIVQQIILQNNLHK